ncbi:MAG: mechanosensitive ion channel [Deltaproteobacteria bacterium]|nr:mechanosensitive ion channel [Deltaproteobacteria bacterium]
MPVLFFRLGLTVALTIWLLLGCPVTGPAQEKPQATEKITAPAASPEVLPRVLTEGAEALEKEVAALKSRAAAAKKGWSQAEKDSQERKAAMAAVKAAQAMKSLPLSDAEETLKKYTVQEERLEKRVKELAQEIETLKKEQAAREASQAALQAEVTRLQATKHPVTRSREMRQSWQRYQRAAAAVQQAAGQLLGSLGKESRLLETEKKLISAVRAELQPYVDAAWKAELLKRQEPVSLSEQAARMFRTLLELPARIAGRLGEMTASGALVAVFQEHLAALIGLLALMVLLAWGVRRLADLLTPLLASWETTAQTLGVQACASLVRITAAHLFLLAAIFWSWLFLWSLGLWEFPAWRGLFYLLLALGSLRLGRHWLKAALAGKEAGGLLPVDADTARFYRKYLQLLLAYLLLGVWGLAQAQLLGFPPASRQFLGHLFRVGLLGGAMWLLRRRYLERLLPELPGPAWFKRPGVIRVLKGLVLLLLGAIILANLLGFQNLADYLAQAGAFTGVALLFLGLLWLGLDAVLHYLLHPEIGWARRRFPHREEMLLRIHGLTRSGVTALLAAAALLLALKAWGLEAARLAWAFQWLNWGATLGSVRLTPLTVGVAALVLYLGVWSSRLVRTLMEVRVFPRTGWDSGIQYTISTTLHYAILILGGLVALNILGFPLTNLALIAGALGVGIGFGLQNIVNNFISGLILLFERPIKVGDILVIDGQWGEVKEIRVRSTVFHTYDRYVLIIPNSELLSGKIVNWTHYGRVPTRLTLEVGVSYGADVRQVTRVLTDVCLANPRVLKEPPPTIVFKAYGDSSLNFTIRVFLQSPEPKERNAATHELNSAIFEAFQREGIEIPFPQRDLYIKNWPAAWSKGGD